MEFKNRNPKLFLIAGKARQGKDTVAKMILDYYTSQGKDCINLQISHYIKEYVMRISDWDGQDETKPRALLQQLGTDLVRHEIDNELFIRRTLEDIRVFSYFKDVITLSDIRFDLEAQRLNEAFPDAYFIKVERPCEQNDLGIYAMHATEQGLHDQSYYDQIILNDGSLEELRAKVETMLEGVK